MPFQIKGQFMSCSGYGHLEAYEPSSAHYITINYLVSRKSRHIKHYIFFKIKLATSGVSEEATRQILTRIANVFNDTDLCDATFVVGEGLEKEEIMAPSQFMAISSTYFKDLF